MGASRTKILYTADWHIGDHCHWALERILSDIRAEKPDILVLGGDLLDCPTLSHYRKDPNRRDSLARSIKKLNHRLGTLRSTKSRFVFIEGNHEERLPKLVADKAPELHEYITLLNGGTPSFRKLVKFPGESLYIRARGMWKYGSIVFHHGDGLASTPKERLRRMGCSVVSGHTHNLALNYATSFSRTTWDVKAGCACNNPPHYGNAPKSDWQHGYAMVHIIRGRAYPEIRHIG